jgi:tetratricopeptide (TPR) repeat protein
MNRGISFRMAGRFQEAQRDHVAADSLYRLAGNRPGRADNLKNLGRVYADKGDAQQAIKIHNRSLKMYESMDNLSGMAELHQQLAIDFGALGDMASAKRHMDQAHRSL